jgi:hypothetical protein
MADNLFNPSDVYNMLQQQGMLPRYIDAAPYGQPNSGLFSEMRNIVIAKDPSKSSFPSVKETRTDSLAHEMTHATQFNLLYPALATIQRKEAAKEKLTPQEIQFSGAMNKLMVENPSLKALVDKLYSTTGNKEYDAYRTELPELQAWGVGYMSRPTNKMTKELANINPHLNPSMATEFSILSNLYSKLPDNVKTLTSKLRQESIQKARKRDRDGMVKESVDIFEDPFKTSIK